MDLMQEVKLHETPPREIVIIDERPRCSGACGKLFAEFYLESGICDECAGL